MSKETFIEYNKNYLPGYTGHVPIKNEIFGCTAGDINKLVTKEAHKPSEYDIDTHISKPHYVDRKYNELNHEPLHQR